MILRIKKNHSQNIKWFPNQAINSIWTGWGNGSQMEKVLRRMRKVLLFWPSLWSCQANEGFPILGNCSGIPVEAGQLDFVMDRYYMPTSLYVLYVASESEQENV